jgi:6-phospho-beta-glucosidase
MVTEAVQQVLGDRAVGICDSPSGSAGASPAAVGRDRRTTSGSTTSGSTTSAGCKGVRDPTATSCSTAARGRAALAGFEEGRLFGGEWLRSLGMIPNEYLYYFYYAADTVNAIRGSRARAARSCSSSSARSTRRPTATTRWRLARDAPRSRAHVHGRGAQRRG